nr:PrgI family protein [uncultured Oscillibacter sp.]
MNKEVRDYQESLFFGLSLRQLLFALLAVIVAVAVYFGLRNTVGSSEIGWICVLAAFPFALGGFFTYNGMTFECFVLAFIRSELLCPKRLVFRSENLYAKALDHSTIKEALQLD